MLLDYLNAVILILFAEMGDKTQFLAMTFATKYPIRKILLGIGIGSLLNHGLAIALGKALVQWLPMPVINIIAGCMFLFFAYTSLNIDEEEAEEKKSKYGPVLTVALAFFLGELGDKTQLSALGLSVNATYPWMTLLGTVTGMVLTSVIGIFIGLKLGKSIPEEKLKMAACFIFVVFGYQKLYAAVFVNRPLIGVIAAVLLLMVTLYKLKKYQAHYKTVGQTPFVHQAEVLKQIKSKIELNVSAMCHGTAVCGVCDGGSCLTGYMKELLTLDNPVDETTSMCLAGLKNKIHSVQEGIEIIQTLVTYYDVYPQEFLENNQLTALRRAAEFMVYDKILICEDYDKYKTFVTEKIRWNLS